MNMKEENAKQLLKEIFAKNLIFYLKINKKSQADLCSDLGFTTSTVSDWINAKKYPRMDKVQILADYFGILKSDLTEKKVHDENEPELIVINRAMKNMSPERKELMMRFLKNTFMEEFKEDD